MVGSYVLLSGNGCPDLARRLAQSLQHPLGQVSIERFADGELRVQIKEEVSSRNVVIVQSLGPLVNDHLMELCLLADAALQSGAALVSAVIPYYGYARQDKQSRPGEPISARVVARMIQASGISKVLTLDLHKDSIMDHFTIPIKQLSAISVLSSAVKEHKRENLLIVAPDAGAISRAKGYAHMLDCPLITAVKKRDLERGDSIESLSIQGNALGKTVVVVDEVISTGGTICRVAKILHAQGVKDIIVCATHYIGVGEAGKLLSDPIISELYVTDSVPIESLLPSMKIVSVDKLLAQEIEFVLPAT